MLDAVVACPIRTDYLGNPYWTEYAVALVLLTWGVIMRRRTETIRRPALIDDRTMWWTVLQAAAWTTGCIYLELVLAPRREPIPTATLRGVRDAGRG